MLTTQPLMWSAADQLTRRTAAGPGSRAFLLVDSAVRWTGTAALVTGLIAALAAGVGVRYLGRRAPCLGLGGRARHGGSGERHLGGGEHYLGAQRHLTRATGVFAFVVCGAFAVLGLLLTLLSPATDSLLDIRTGLPGTLVLLGIPLAAIGVAGRRCLSAA